MMQKPADMPLTIVSIFLALMGEKQSLAHLHLPFSLRTSARELGMMLGWRDSVSFQNVLFFLYSHHTTLMPQL